MSPRTFFSCSEWLEQQSTGDLHVFIRLGMSHLAADQPFNALARDRATAVGSCPEGKRGSMVKWWETAVARHGSIIRSACTTFSPAQPISTSAYLGLDMVVILISVLEWLEMGGRAGLWEEYLDGGTISKNFLREFKTYEKKSHIDRRMLVAVLRRHFKRGLRGADDRKLEWKGLKAAEGQSSW